MGAPVTLILGLGRDVGLACARRCQSDGHRLVVASPDEVALGRAQEHLGDDVAYHHGDLQSKLGLRNVLTAAIEAYGRHDNVMFTPPLPDPVPLAEFELGGFDKAMGSGARAAALLLTLFASAIKDQSPLEEIGPDRKRQAATVTFILSLTSRLSSPGQFMEAVSQGAIENIVRAGAIELAEQHIRVNAISALRPRAEAAEAWLKERTPAARAATSAEIADAAAFLASPHSAIITGETLYLDGGRRHLNGLMDR
ncbi:MAG: SDR family oxidoreductase [Pseudomonadota bacterium]